LSGEVEHVVCGGYGKADATTAAGRERSVWSAARERARLTSMAIHPDLLEILACPVCKTPVEVVKEGAGLRCAQCRRVYPVREDIPIMLPEEAILEA
jgi:uncharacterized protein YbaR (Trm112 family)